MAHTFSWLSQSHLMSKDNDGLCATAEAFVYVAMPMVNTTIRKAATKSVSRIIPLISRCNGVKTRRSARAPAVTWLAKLKMFPRMI
jgi:hypothetical protein